MPVAEVDYERSLAAMWHAFRAARFRVPQSVEIDPSVVAALLNARYYDSSRAQFLTEDPIFLSSSQNLQDPQSLNAYAYSEDNPVTNEDPSGRYSLMQVATGQATWSQYWGDVDQGEMIMGETPAWNFAFNHPYIAGFTVVGPLSAVAAGSGVSAAAAFGAAAYPGVGAGYAASQTFAGLIYSALTYDSLNGIGNLLGRENSISLKNPSSALSTVGSLTWQVGPMLSDNEYVGAFSDAAQLANLLTNTLGSSANSLFSNSIQTRASTVSTFNSAIESGGGSSESSAGLSVPSSNSLWVTPSGAVVNWGGQLVSAPPSK
jgi:RHS repeat-associated protein